MFTPVIETTGKVIGEHQLGPCAISPRSPPRGFGDAQATIRQFADVLARNPHDVAFAVVYQLAPTAGRRRSPPAPASPTGNGAVPGLLLKLKSGDGDVDWIEAATSAFEGRPETVAGLAGRSATAGLPSHPWPEPPDRAILLPIAFAGQERPQTILVAGLSPRLEFDQGYREFLELVGGQLATAALQLARLRSREEARRGARRD